MEKLAHHVRRILHVKFGFIGPHRDEVFGGGRGGEGRARRRGLGLHWKLLGGLGRKGRSETKKKKQRQKKRK
jgi:hypothetical protein